MSERRQLVAGDAIPPVRFVAECKQDFAASGHGARPGDGKHFVRAQVGGPVFARRTGEGAIVTGIATELRERNEDFARIRDDAAVGAIAAFGGSRHHCRKIVAVEQGKDIVRCKAALRFATAPARW